MKMAVKSMDFHRFQRLPGAYLQCHSVNFRGGRRGVVRRSFVAVLR